MWSSILPSLGQAAALAVWAQLGMASPQGGAQAEGEAAPIQVEPTRTGKERLGGKASDEQRVDNCNVPVELRGPRPRPDDCAATHPSDDGAKPMPAAQPVPPDRSR